MRLLPATVLAYCAFVASPAVAQAPSGLPLTASTSEPSTSVSSVTVTGQRAAVRTSIDRRTYNIARDVNAATGSIADVMRTLPSVSVDVQGEVSLRGAAVQILIDGKRLAVLDGPDRAEYLQQLPASTIESVEIITNPSSEFAPDGAGGVINIITKKVNKVGKTSSIQVGGGSYGRRSITVLGGYRGGPFNINATLGARTQPSRQSGNALSARVDPTLNLRTDTVSQNAGEVEQTNFIGSVTVDYDAAKVDRLTLGLAATVRQSETTDLYAEIRRNAVGGLERDYVIDRTGSLDGVQGTVSLGWRHTFAEPGRELNLSLRHTEYGSTSRNRLVYAYRTPIDLVDVRRVTENDSPQRALTAAYVTPLPHDAVLKLGYDFRRQQVGQDFRGVEVDALGEAQNLANYSNHFVVVDRNHQAYATYQRPFSKLTVLAGLRLEVANTEYDQRTTAITGDESYGEVHPSLNLQYALTDHQILAVSYSHRVQRPIYSQLNPFLVVTDEFSATRGNPNLRPQETHSLEAGWRWQRGASTAAATAYHRKNYNTIGAVNSFLTPTIILNTFENQGASTSSGLELSAGSQLGTAITWRSSANLSYTQLQRSTLGGGGVRSAFGYSVTGTVEYRPTDKDLVQVTGAYDGRQIFAQGYRLPTGALNLGYQRKFSANLIGVVTVSDIFASTRAVIITDTATLFGTSYVRPVGRTLSIGFTRVFGGRPPREGQFDYDAPQP